MTLVYLPYVATGKLTIEYPPPAPNEIKKVHKFMREWVDNNIPSSNLIRIQYGGPVNDDNIEELLKCPDIDGLYLPI